MYNATQKAREIAMTNRAVLVEAMSYRLGHHSTSDDSTAYRFVSLYVFNHFMPSYRSADEVTFWDKTDEPIKRLRLYMYDKKYWSESDEKSWAAEARKLVLTHFAAAEKNKFRPIETMFDDVYAEKPLRLQRQMAEMQEHVKAHKEHFPTLDMYEK